MRTTTIRPITTALVALTVAGVLGACSGSGGGSGAGDDDVATLSDDDTDEQAQADPGDDGEAELLDWVECMRGEGVDLPDPTRDADGNLVLNGNGITIGGGGGGTTRNDSADDGDEPPIDREEMEAATEVCGPPPAIGGELSEEELQDQQDAALAFAECMREEGIEDFPDPDFSDMGPGSGPQTNSNDAGEGDGGGPVVAGPFGQIDLGDPQTAAAFEACQDVMGPGPGDGGPGEAPESPAGATS
jgi:hypothetical protein